MRRVALVALVLLAQVASVGVAAASVRGSPDLSVSLADDVITPGSDERIQVQLVNTGDLDTGSNGNPALNEAVTTARGVDVAIGASDAPFVVETQPSSVGQLPQGGSVSLPVDLSVPDDADPGTYTIPVTVRYTHTEVVSEATGARQSADVERTVDVTVEVRATPRFRVVDVQRDLRVGSTGTVELTLANVGASPAHEATVAVESANGALLLGETRAASRFVGTWAPGERRTLAYQVRATDDAASQRYAFTATARYEDEDGDAGQSEPLGFAVRPGPEQRFAVESVTSDVAVGEDGDVTVQLRNDGPVTVRDATVQLAASQPALRFGNATRATRFVGTWEPGETHTLTYDVTASGRAEPRSYAVTATVAYRDADGDRRTERAGSLGVVPEPEQSFAYRNVSVTLTGSTARVTGRVVNTGDRPVADALVTADSVAPEVRVVDGSYPVGTLAPGTSARFDLTLRVAPDTDPGPRRLGLAVQYDGDTGRAIVSDTTPVQVPIRTDAPTLRVEAVTATLGVDTSNTVRVRVENVGDTRLTDVRARLGVQPPYESNAPTSYVATLAPGERTTMTFEVTTPEDGIHTEDAIPLNVTAETPHEQRIVSGPHYIPVTIGRPGGGTGSTPRIAVGVVAVVLVLAAGWWYQR